MSNPATAIDLDSFYQSMMHTGNLCTPKHATRLTFAVLHRPEAALRTVIGPK